MGPKLEELEEALNTLGLPKLITESEIKKRYRDLAKEYHPDLPTGDSKKMQEIQRAYEVLMDYIKRYRFSFDEEEFRRQNPLSDYQSRFKF